VSANYSNPAPEPGARDSHPPAEDQSGGEKTFADTHLQVDPQQQFREYTSPGRGSAPGTPQLPSYPTPGAYQPGNPGQVMEAPGQAVYPGQVPGGYQPGNPGQVTGALGQATYPGQVPGAWSGYPSYAAYPGQTPGTPGQQMPFYPGYNPYAAYPGYAGYGWVPVPAKPKRDTYILVVGIVAFACSCLVILGGLGSLGILGLFNLSPVTTTLSGSTYFASIFLLLTFAFAGLVGGGFCLYHSIRSLFLQKPSRTVWLPRFWIFLLCYLATLGAGFWLHVNGLDVSSSLLTGTLIYLGAIFPALTIMALGIRRLSFPKAGQRTPGGSGQVRKRFPTVAQWPTSWRRLTLALVSGATLSIGLASILELILQLILLGSQSGAVTQYISNPNSGNPPPSLFGLLLVLLSVIAPLVEELVKPLAVVILIGRVRSKAEAFTLGLACGIGFNLVETTGYISSGYNDWLTVALVRSGAGLLHGLGAAMVSLGWYYLTHKEEGRWRRRALVALGCAVYAVLQHAIWNGSVALVLLPDPFGSFFQNWSWNLGTLSIDGIEFVNIAEMICILIFFVYISGRLRAKAQPKPGAQPAEGTLAAPA
jgi:RsiW-degrading membrane proteinase PrsW (M82 family)